MPVCIWKFQVYAIQEVVCTDISIYTVFRVQRQVDQLATVVAVDKIPPCQTRRICFIAHPGFSAHPRGAEVAVYINTLQLPLHCSFQRRGHTDPGFNGSLHIQRGAGVAVCIHSSLSCFAHFSSEGVWIMVSTVDCSFHCFAHFSSQGVQITVSMVHCTPKRGWCGSIQTLQFVLLCFTSAPRVCGSRFQRFTACTPKRGWNVCVHTYTAASFALLTIASALRAQRSWFQWLILHIREGLKWLCTYIHCSFICSAEFSFSSEGTKIRSWFQRLIAQPRWAEVVVYIHTLQFPLLCSLQ